MRRPPTVSVPQPRRGVILLVVLALLTLFAVVGLSFVLYANSAAASARLAREANTLAGPDLEPELLLAHFLGQFLYDVPDDARGVYSGLRGHSLARSMFGLNYTLAPDGTWALIGNDTPFNGTGRLHHPSPFPHSDNPYLGDDFFLINYTYFAADQLLRDPERLAPRRQLPAKGSPDNRTPFAGGFNAPYTYPDLNNLFLAVVKGGPAFGPDGKTPVAPPGAVLMPSFHRPWLFGSLADIPDPAQGKTGNPNWTNREGKYLLLRPRPVDMGPGFPYPEDEGGDVKNLPGGPGTLYFDPRINSFQLANNDSIWLDLDFPVMTAPDGRKFKPLFAPLVIDLDNRVNVNVAGNLRGKDQTAHASNSGWGAWEVNPSWVLNQNPTEWTALLRGNVGRDGRYGRDPWPHSALPGNTAPRDQSPHLYAPTDFDGSNERAAGAPSQALRLPGTAPSLPYQCFPNVPAGYGNDTNLERVNHPKLFNPFAPTLPDRTFALAGMEALLRYGDTNSPGLTSDLFQLCPQNFGDPSDPVGAARRRGLVTLGSFDPDRPGVTPWFWPETGPAYNQLGPNQIRPAGAPVAYPPLLGGRPASPDSEFSPDRRAAADLTGLLRLDLNRYLPDYPKPDATGLIIDYAGFLTAQRARQELATDIFRRLWKLTGAGDPLLVPPQPPWAVGQLANRWNGFRCLAQLAVNIVDYIDNDDYITPFMWYPPHRGNPQGEWVYGTELPRLVLNEAYIQYDNDPEDPGLRHKPDPRHPREHKATFYNVNVWVELFNPLFADPTLTDEGKAVLQVAGRPVYQVVLSRGEPNLRAPYNVRGIPLSRIPPVSSYDPDPNAVVVVRPSNGRYAGPEGGNEGFYVLGPQVGFLPGANPGLPATLLSPQMTYQVGAASFPQNQTILLRRLACPHLPPNDYILGGYNPKLPYNPYVTVDYVENVPVNDGRLFNDHGPHTPLPMPQRHSWGRKQPYAAHKTQQRRQVTQPPHFDRPQHTFFQQNCDVSTPGPNHGTPPPDYPAFDWLVHLDRPLISPAELFQVSAFKPHELTQQFMTGDTPATRFTHLANWLDEDLAAAPAPRSHRLYRALEFLSTHSLTSGMKVAATASRYALPEPGLNREVYPFALSGQTASGGSWRIVPGSVLVIDRGVVDQGVSLEEVVRVKTVDPTASPPVFTADFLKPHRALFRIEPTTVSERLPGKINLNTIWDEETFLALCDPQPSNGFSNPEVARTMFRQLKASRTVGSVQGPETPGPGDRPFRSLAAGFYPYSDSQFPNGGIQDTLLRSNPPDPQPLLAVPGMSHPYQTWELLTKVFNNVTVRSNVFAVWVTVGFFEVTDETSRPVKLGTELGRAEGRHVRHRMFAIVDRSRLTANPGPQPSYRPGAPPSPDWSSGLVVPYVSVID